jgi:hypothetical protein
MTDKEYRQSSPELRKAWLAYNKLNPENPTSVTSFVAGWNAAKHAALSCVIPDGNPSLVIKKIVNL